MEYSKKLQCRGRPEKGLKMDGLNKFCKETNGDVREKGFWDSYDTAIDYAREYGADGIEKAIKNAWYGGEK